MSKRLDRRVVAFWFALAASGAIWIAVMGYWGAHGMSRSFTSVSQSQDALTGLKNVQALVESAEASVHSYVITGNDWRLKPFWTAQAELPGQLRRLSTAVSESPAQKKSIRLLRQVIPAHIEYLLKHPKA